MRSAVESENEVLHLIDNLLYTSWRRKSAAKFLNAKSEAAHSDCVPLEQVIGVRIPGGQPNLSESAPEVIHCVRLTFPSGAVDGVLAAHSSFNLITCLEEAL